MQSLISQLGQHCLLLAVQEEVCHTEVGGHVSSPLQVLHLASSDSSGPREQDTSVIAQPQLFLPFFQATACAVPVRRSNPFPHIRGLQLHSRNKTAQEGSRVVWIRRGRGRGRGKGQSSWQPPSFDLSDMRDQVPVSEVPLAPLEGDTLVHGPGSKQPLQVH